MSIVRANQSLVSFLDGKIRELVVEKKRGEEEDMKFIKVKLSEKIKKLLSKTVSLNGYVNGKVEITGRVFDLLLKTVKCEKWIPVRKTRNCDRRDHCKVTSFDEMLKIVELECTRKKVGYSVYFQDDIMCDLRCGKVWPVFFAYNRKTYTLWFFISYFVYWKRNNQALADHYELKKGRRREPLEW